jgi:uncharacterized protein YbjT (DUF2867 family)
MVSGGTGGSRTILILGGTGRVGGATLRQLMRLPAERQPYVHLLSRQPERLPALTLPHVVHRGGIEDQAALHGALCGVDAVLLVTGDNPWQVEREGRVIDAARRAGRPRIVKISAIIAGRRPRVSFGRLHGEIEDRIRRSGLRYTILRPSFFYQSLELFAQPLRKGRLVAPAGGGRIAFIDVNDVGAIAAKVLTECEHNRATYDLTGPRAWSMSEVAEAFACSLERHVRYVSPPLLAARLTMKLAGGMDWWLSGQVTELFAAIQAGAEGRVAADAANLLGRKPLDLQDYIAASRQFWSTRH